MRQQRPNPPRRVDSRRAPPERNHPSDRFEGGPAVFHYPLPGIRQSDAGHVNELENGACNFFLRFHRFLGYPWKWEFKTASGKDAKESRWKATLKRGNAILKDPGFKSLYEPFFQEQAKLLESVDPSRKREFTIATKARLCVGFAEASALETGIKLHPLYGVPYILGSAVKGVTRSIWLLDLASGYKVPYLLDPQLLASAKHITESKASPLELFEELALAEEIEKERLGKMRADWRKLGEKVPEKLPDIFTEEAISKIRQAAAAYRACFGSQEAMGEVVFFDAYPDLKAGKDVFELDVLTPHYSEYYTGSATPAGSRTPPADYLSPKPTFFLTVKSGAAFLFRLYLRGLDEKVIEEAEKWLKTALTLLGVGSKTSVGYGTF